MSRKKILLVASGVAAVLAMVTFVALRDTPVAQAHEKIVVHKTTTCGCCAAYVKYLNTMGYDVTVHNMSDAALGAKKTELGVPGGYESCHTSEMAKYTVEGHVPHEALAQLMAKKPTNIIGIGLPGMPMGAPGMAGAKYAPFAVYTMTYVRTVGGEFGRF